MAFRVTRESDSRRGAAWPDTGDDRFSLGANSQLGYRRGFHVYCYRVRDLYLDKSFPDFSGESDAKSAVMWVPLSMRIVIAGAHGQIAMRLGRILSDADHEVIGIVRNPMHSPDLANAGMEAVVLDLEKIDVSQLTPVVRGADVVVFAAGAGPGSGAERKETVDRAAAALLADAAQNAGVSRYILISAMGVESELPPGTDEVFRVYLKAKAASEIDLKDRDLNWLILRPGRLTNDQGVGKVELAESVPRGEITRDDVAAVVAELIAAEVGHVTLEVSGGEEPIAQAVRKFV